MRADLAIAVLFLSIPVTAGALLSAAEPQRRSAEREQGNMRFAGMDRNRDGVITRAEWRGSDESFRVHDWNADGMLSGEEVRPGARRGGRAERDYDPASPGEFDDWSADRFADLDHNGDGRLTRDEWHYEPETFRRSDRNRDGVLTREEFLGDGLDDDREDRFRYLDANRDGRISRDEWHGSADAFDWLDRNRDGVLTHVEVVGDDDADADRFSSLDTNRNGVISRNEWHWSGASFERLDRDRSGTLTRDELQQGGSTPVGTSGAARAIEINPAVRWTETGVLLQPGDRVRIQATGRIQLSTNESDVAGPDGARSGRSATEAPLPAYTAGALIARVGDSGPLFVGSDSTLRAPAGGQLYLGVNDDHLPDNSGEFRVTITVQPRQDR